MVVVQENFDQTIMKLHTYIDAMAAVQKDDHVNREPQHEINTGNQIVEHPSQGFTPLSLVQL